MGSRMTRNLAVAALLLSASALVQGCATVGAQGEPSRMVATVASVENDYRLAKLQLPVTDQSLNDLYVADVKDLEQAYGEFAENVARIERTGDRIVTHADQMHYGGASYLVEAGLTPNACLYPRRRIAEDTKSVEFGEYFYPVADEGWEVKRAYRAYQFDISQIRNILAANLTPGSVYGLSPVIRKAMVDARSLDESLSRVIRAIETARSAQAAAAPQAPPPPPPAM